MKRRWVSLTALLLPSLASCGGDKASTIFTPDNVYGSALPGAAKVVSPEEFEAAVKSGELTLMRASDNEKARQAAEVQLAKDRAFLEALPNKSEALTLLLGPTTGTTATPGGDLVTTAKDSAGTSFTVRTMGEAVMLRTAVSAYEQARVPANALAVYQLAYEHLAAALKAKVAAPSSLTGKSLAEIQAALDALNALLDAQSNLDPVQEAVQPKDVTIISGGYGAGAGPDGPTSCGPSRSDSIYARLRWPLKQFLPPVKDQSARGLCWDFSAVGAIETRERVVHNSSVNLSEQYFNNVHKRDAFLGIDFRGEGDFPDLALGKFVDRNLPIALEDEWTYNAGGTRVDADNFFGICKGYTGYCSETTHESPTTCAQVGSDVYCGFLIPTYAGLSTVHADRARLVWENSIISPTPPVAVMRQLLAGGQPLIATFPVLTGFDSPNGGYITDSANMGYLGGHVAQLVGFAPDGSVPFAPPIDGGTGGGFFVLKNSWGCAGDAGYYYVPALYLQRFFNVIHVLDSTAERSQAWTDELAAYNGPAVTLSTLNGNASVPLNRSFSVTATITGGGPNCCGLQWSPAPESVSGNTASFRFATPGPQTISVTASTAAGQTISQSLALDVVNGAPHAIIESPAPGIVFRGQTISLSGYGLDPNEGPGPQDGLLSSCTWTSDSPTTEGPWNGCLANVVFSTNGTRNLTLQVVDSQGLSGQASVGVIVEDPPTNYPPTPQITIQSSGAGPLYDWNNTFTFSGNATDPESNTPFSYAWTVTALTEAGTPEGTPLDLGTSINALWKPVNSYSFFYGSGACATTSGQRVRVSFAVTDSMSQTGLATKEVRISCPPP